MSSTAHKKVRKASIELLIYVAALFVLLLTSINVDRYLVNNKVLGVETVVSTEVPNNQLYWSNFLSKNPNYIPGWVEIGRVDKAREIDPNFK